MSKRATGRPLAFVPPLAAVLLIGLLSSGCPADDIVFVDPPVKLEQDDTPKVTGEVFFELGFYYEGEYSRFEKGAPIPVVHGLQGGTWTMPTVRSGGLPAFGNIECLLETDAGELVGYVNAKSKFYLSPLGILEISNFPIPVYHPENPMESIDDLYGQSATLDCFFSQEDGAEEHFGAGVIIHEG
jgi:hypothetical protein